MISDEKVEFIAQQINASNIKSKELRDDLIDHFCCIVELHMQKGQSFEMAFSEAYDQTTPNGYNEIEEETLFLLNYQKIKRMKKVTFSLGYLFSLSTSLGILFKILHLPGANIMLIGGFTGLAFIFTPLYLVNLFKSKVNSLLSEKLKWIFGAASIVLIACASWFKIMHLQGAGVLLGVGFLVLGFGFLPFLFFRMAKSNKIADN